MANVTKERKMAEAVRRMNLLGVFPDTVEQFRMEGKLSMCAGKFGGWYWLEDNEQVMAQVREFEAKYDALVYAVLPSVMNFGDGDEHLWSFLYVSDNEDEWQSDREALKNGEQVCYVYNETCDWNSELGWCGIKSYGAGGVRRTY